MRALCLEIGRGIECARAIVKAKSPAVDGAMRAISFAGVLGVLLQMLYAGGMVAVLNRGPFSFGSSSSPPDATSGTT